jgi:P-type Mg2+ transporter
MNPPYPAYWTQPIDDLLVALATSPQGLSADEAEQRLAQVGRNSLRNQPQATFLRMFFGQFTSPLVLILIFAAVVSAIVGEWMDASIVLIIVLGSALLSFGQEYTAANAVAKLRARITLKTNVLRNGRVQAIPAEENVPGDIALLSAGSLIAADGIVLESKDFFVNQVVLTGETFPVEKKPGAVLANANLSERTNCVFMGTNVRSGTARVLIVQIGAATAYGQIAERLTLRPPETEFERGIRHFGYMLTQVMLVLVLVVFAANVFNAKPQVEALLFAVALAVGLAPELLPAIVTLTLSHGAQHMAAHRVIVRRLSTIENLGSMDVLCTDKTGTLTKGVVRLDGALDALYWPSATRCNGVQSSYHSTKRKWRRFNDVMASGAPRVFVCSAWL